MIIILENETHRLLGDFERHADPQISARWSHLVIISKKKSCRIVNFVFPADHRVKLKESEKRDKYVDLARELKTMEHEGDGDVNCNWCFWNNPQTGNGLEDLEIRGQVETIPTTAL